jgi:hypothetical protein
VSGNVSDSLCGDLLGAGNGKCVFTSSTCTATLATGASCSITYDYGKQHVANTPDPLVNTVLVHYNPEGFPNNIEDNASDTIDVLHPNLTVTKDCLTEAVQPEGSAKFDIQVKNTGDTVLTVTTNESEKPGPFSMNPGETVQFEATIGPGTGPTADNTVSVSATLPEDTGLTNVLTRSAADSCPRLTPAVLGFPPTGGSAGFSDSTAWWGLILAGVLLMGAVGVSFSAVRVRDDD